MDWREPLRFLIVGTLNVCVSFAVFRISYLAFAALAGTSHERVLPLIAALATATGYLAGTVNSFVLNRAWTFKVPPMRGQVARFLTLNAAVLLASSTSIASLTAFLNAPVVPAWVAVTAAMTVANYLGCKLWAFPVPLAHQQTSASAK